MLDSIVFYYFYYDKTSGTIIPAITIKRQMKYNTFQTICFGRTCLQAKIATITIIIAVAIPCNALTTVALIPHAERIKAMAYKTVTATIVQKDILLSPQLLRFELDELLFELLFAIITSYYFYYRKMKILCQIF